MMLAHWLRQDVDLSYINIPNISTLLLVAGFAGVRAHQLCWAIEEPPQECMDMLLTRPDGTTLRQQLRQRELVSPCVSRLECRPAASTARCCTYDALSRQRCQMHSMSSCGTHAPSDQRTDDMTCTAAYCS
jgi:hypothetical protein